MVTGRQKERAAFYFQCQSEIFGDLRKMDMSHKKCLKLDASLYSLLWLFACCCFLPRIRWKNFTHLLWRLWGQRKWQGGWFGCRTQRSMGNYWSRYSTHSRREQVHISKYCVAFDWHIQQLARKWLNGMSAWMDAWMDGWMDGWTLPVWPWWHQLLEGWIPLEEPPLCHLQHTQHVLICQRLMWSCYVNNRFI